MSEQEKKSNSGAEGSSVVLVEQPAASRHKQPFRPTELQEEAPDLHHRRSRAPAVPTSVAEELKDNANSENKDRRECERAMSSEKQRQSMAKKLSTTAKRRASSPEAIVLTQLDVDTKLPTQPIPPQVSSVASMASDLNVNKLTAERKDENDSITDEIAELRTPEVSKKASDWDVKSHDTNKKEALNDSVYLNTSNVEVQAIGAQSVCFLERKSSIGPCFRTSAPYGRPSGIAIHLPKKHVKSAGDENHQPKSVINITLSKKCLVNKTINQMADQESEQTHQIHRLNFFGSLKEKFVNMTARITHAVHV